MLYLLDKILAVAKINFCKTPENIFETIKILASSELIEKLPPDIAEENLIDEVSRLAQFNKEKLYNLVSNLLRIEYISEIHTPSINLINQFGMGVETLKAIPAVPQAPNKSQSYYTLCTANIQKLDKEYLKRKGIKISLSNKDAISDTWDIYDKQEASISNMNIKIIVQTLEKLAHSLRPYRIRNVKILPQKYTFKTKQGEFVGDLDANLHKALVALIKNKKTYKLKSKQYKNLQLIYEPTNITFKWQCYKRTQKNKSTQIKNTKHELLLVEDNKAYGTIVSSILNKQGFNISQCANGDSALKFLASHNYEPDAIICDMHMPMMDGLGFVKKMRSFGAQTPILMLTSEDDPEIELKLAESGADAYIKKSENPEILIAWCKRLIERNNHKNYCQT